MDKKKKRKWKNGLSITPFVTQKKEDEKDKGDVEKGIENFNSMTTIGNSTNNTSCSSTSDSGTAMMEGAMKDLYMDVQEQGEDEYVRRNRLKIKNRKSKINRTTNKNEKARIQKEIDDLEAKIKVVLSEPATVKQNRIQSIKDKIDTLQRELRIDIDKEPYDWRPYVERRLARLKKELSSLGVKESLMKKEQIKEDLNNVTEVEDKAKEVMDPTFASAVREIRSHDKGRAELKKVRKAPKEGEESLPKDLKFTLEESLFEGVEDVEKLRGESIEFPNGEVLTIDFKDGKLIAGGVTNAGVIPEFELEYDDDFSTDWNLQALYDLCIESRPELLGEITESKKPLKEEVSDEAYEIAEEIDDYFSSDDFISREDFDERFTTECENILGIDFTELDPDGAYDLNEIENDVRGILAQKGWETIYEGDDEGGLERLSADKPHTNEIIYNALREYEENHHEFENRTWQKVINKLIDYYDMHMTDEHDIDRYDESLKESYNKHEEYIKYIDKAIYILEDNVDADVVPEVDKAVKLLYKAVEKLEKLSNKTDESLKEEKKSKEPKKVFTVKRKNIKEGVTARRFPSSTK